MANHDKLKFGKCCLMVTGDKCGCNAIDHILVMKLYVMYVGMILAFMKERRKTKQLHLHY